MHLVTVANNNHPGLELWKATAEMHGWKPTILGLGEAFTVGWGHGFGAKFLYMKTFLQSIQPHELVVFTDGYDVVFQDGPKRVQDAVQDLDAVLFAAELLENPDKKQYPPHPPSRIFNFLNAGIYAGTAQRILDIMPTHFESSIEDQRHFTSIYLSTNKIVLDHTASVFACFYGFHTWTAHNTTVRVQSSTPVILHMQGAYKDAYRIVSVLTTNTQLLHWAKEISRKPSLAVKIYSYFTKAVF